jgi:molybdopterin/thiamine biosynthesis adenylyltransferase
MNSRKTSEKIVVVVGAGGNIGSHLVSHLARTHQVARVVLIDKDTYEPANLSTQDITPCDIGKSKAMVQARRLRKITPSLCVQAIADAVEHVPLGKLRADVILSCLDSRIARQHVNQFAWRLGVPLIDAGVEAGDLLARVNVYAPGPESPCLECAWDDRDYEALEQTYPCQGFEATIAATNAPSSLGALAAALQAIECQKLLTNQIDRAAISKQVLIDASYHRHYVTSFRRNPMCRFGDHEVWSIEKLRCSLEQISIEQVLKLGPMTGNGSVSLRLEGKPFVRRLTCPSCGATQPMLRLECSLRDREKTCARCGKRMIATGFDLLERLNVGSVTQADLMRSLRSLGLRPGDVFSVGDDRREFHYEIAQVDQSQGVG